MAKAEVEAGAKRGHRHGQRQRHGPHPGWHCKKRATVPVHRMSPSSTTTTTTLPAAAAAAAAPAIATSSSNSNQQQPYLGWLLPGVHLLAVN